VGSARKRRGLLRCNPWILHVFPNKAKPAKALPGLRLLILHKGLRTAPGSRKPVPLEKLSLPLPQESFPAPLSGDPGPIHWAYFTEIFGDVKKQISEELGARSPAKGGGAGSRLAWSKERGARSLERGAWSTEHGAKSKERRAGSEEQGAKSRERGAWSMEHGAGRKNFMGGVRVVGGTSGMWSGFLP